MRADGPAFPVHDLLQRVDPFDPPSGEFVASGRVSVFDVQRVVLITGSIDDLPLLMDIRHS